MTQYACQANFRPDLGPPNQSLQGDPRGENAPALLGLQHQLHGSLTGASETKAWQQQSTGHGPHMTVSLCHPSQTAPRVRASRFMTEIAVENSRTTGGAGSCRCTDESQERVTRVVPLLPWWPGPPWPTPHMHLGHGLRAPSSSGTAPYSCSLTRRRRPLCASSHCPRPLRLHSGIFPTLISHSAVSRQKPHEGSEKPAWHQTHAAPARPVRACARAPRTLSRSRTWHAPWPAGHSLTLSPRRRL